MPVPPSFVVCLPPLSSFVVCLLPPPPPLSWYACPLLFRGMPAPLFLVCLPPSFVVCLPPPPPLLWYITKKKNLWFVDLIHEFDFNRETQQMIGYSNIPLIATVRGGIAIVRRREGVYSYSDREG